MRRLVLCLLAVLVLTRVHAQQSSHGRVHEPAYDQTFDTYIAGLTPSRHWTFGTGVSVGNPIKNTSDLATHFEAYQDGTETTVINAETQRYMPFSSTDNFVFGPDYLALKGTLARGHNA